jgi:hypothetical protein
VGNSYKFSPGQSGNPRGRPTTKLPELQFRSWYMERFNDPCDLPADMKKRAGIKDEWTWGQAYCQMLLMHAMVRGRPTAIREINERLWGKVPLPLRLTPASEEESQTELKLIVVPQGKVPDAPMLASLPGGGVAVLPSNGKVRGEGDGELPE